MLCSQDLNKSMVVVLCGMREAFPYIVAILLIGFAVWFAVGSPLRLNSGGWPGQRAIPLQSKKPQAFSLCGSPGSKI